MRFVCDRAGQEQAAVPAGDVSLVSDGFSLVRRVGGPDGLRANGAHAPHGGEQRSKELSFALSLCRFSPSWVSGTHQCSRAQQASLPLACPATSRRKTRA